MTLEEALKIQSSLTELSVDVEEFSWGPSYELAMERRKEALGIISKEINKLSLTEDKLRYNHFRVSRLHNIMVILEYLIKHNPSEHKSKLCMLECEMRKFYEGADYYDKRELQCMYDSHFHLESNKEIKELHQFFINLCNRKSLDK
jgi:hypothetical protein